MQGSGINLIITTKSNLVTRDIDLIKTYPNPLVAWSINTLDEEFKKDMDSAPTIKSRIEAMKQVHDAGIRTNCFISPIFPGITDVFTIIEKIKDFCDYIWLENLNLRGTFKPTIINYIKDYGVDIDEYEEVEKYFLNEEDFYKRDDMSIPPLAISLSDFNKLRNMQGYEQINLANYEYTTQWDGNTEDSEIENYINQNKFLNVSGSDMKISKDGYYKETLGEGIYNYPAKNIIILPDEICKGLVGAGVDLFITTNNEMKYEDALEFEYEYIPTWFENNNKDLMKKYDSSYQFIVGRIKSAETSEILNASLGMRILGLYLGTVLLMISLTVLALQQLTDSIEHKQRFNILRKLGIEEGEINKIVLKQIGIYFAIPVTIGVIGFVVFIYNYYHIFETQMSSYVGDKMFILNMIIGIVLMIIVYVSYFLGTYYTFKRNIKN